MKTFCIICPEFPEKNKVAKEHFDKRGLHVNFVNGIHGETFGLLPSRPYNADFPGRGHLIPIAHVGLTLSHYMVWSICEQLDEDFFMILEDDAKFTSDWRLALYATLDDLPSDWDIFNLGASNTSDKPKEHICGDVWEVKYPFTTHCYLIRKKAIPTLLASCRDATLNIDLLLIREAYPKLKVYSMIPRLVNQRGTELEP